MCGEVYWNNWMVQLSRYMKNAYFEWQLEVGVQLLVQEAAITRALKYKVRLIAVTVAGKQRPTKIWLWWQDTFFQRFWASVHNNNNNNNNNNTWDNVYGADATDGIVFWLTM